MRLAPVLAVAASAMVGSVCGVGGGLLLNHGPFVADPLHLGVPVENQTCDGQTLLMLGWGGAAPPLAAGIQENPSHARYLDTKQSCATAYALEGRADPQYVAYIGPFSTREQACSLRMSEQYRGDIVTSLNDGNTDPVECACYLPATRMPPLRTGMDTTTVDSIWIRSLQRMLTDLKFLNRNETTGLYLQSSVDAVKAFQSEHGLRPNGVVDSTTWHSLLTQACRLYDS